MHLQQWKLKGDSSLMTPTWDDESSEWVYVTPVFKRWSRSLVTSKQIKFGHAAWITWWFMFVLFRYTFELVLQKTTLFMIDPIISEFHDRSYNIGTSCQTSLVRVIITQLIRVVNKTERTTVVIFGTQLFLGGFSRYFLSTKRTSQQKNKTYVLFVIEIYTKTYQKFLNPGSFCGYVTSPPHVDELPNRGEKVTPKILVICCFLYVGIKYKVGPGCSYKWGELTPISRVK